MKLSITFQYPLSLKRNIHKKVGFNSLDEKFVDICYNNMEHKGLLTFDNYYGESPVMFEGEMFPYILRQGKYIWNISYNDVSIEEFLNTHHLTIDDEILVLVDAVAGAGTLFDSLYQGWIASQPIFEALGTAITVYEIVKIIKNSFGKFKKDKPRIGDFYQFIEKKDRWDLEELSKQLNADIVFVEKCLIVAGYESENNQEFLKNEAKNEKFNQLFYSPPKESSYEVYGVNLDIAYLQVLCYERNSDEELTIINQKLHKVVDRHREFLEVGSDKLSIRLKKAFDYFEDESGMILDLMELSEDLHKIAADMEKELNMI